MPRRVFWPISWRGADIFGVVQMTITLTREEAQQVLDAFAWELGGEPIGTEIQKSVDLLRARLAQPEQRTGDCLLTGVCAAEGHRIQKAQPEPEPVAWYWSNGIEFTIAFEKTDGHAPMYLHPPQREWQGLTDEEILDEYRQSYGDDGDLTDVYFARTIEAKLKEKNT